MKQENEHVDPKVEEMLSCIETHAKNIRHQNDLMEMVDNLAEAEVSAPKRHFWLYWAGATVAACVALVLFVVPKDAPRVAINPAGPVLASTQDEHFAAAAYSPAETKKTSTVLIARQTAELDDGLGDNAQELQPSIVPTLPMKEEAYAYSETEDGIRVYCEYQCNAEEVIAHLEEIVKQSIVKP